MLNTYLMSTRQKLNDTAAQFYATSDLTDYINQARNRVAAASQCCRYLPPSSGSFVALGVSAGGSGYTSAPTVTISGPDAIGAGFVQATATATIAGGQVTGFTITNAGTGYVNPTITLSGGGGAGAVASITLTSFLATVANQEIYNFATASATIPAGAGLASVIGLQSVAVSWGAQKPVLRWIDWSAFQAYFRSINYGSNWPVIWSQYAQGIAGSIYLYPIPSQTMAMDWDCYCLPIPLVDDTTVEAIPYPFDSAVTWYAAYLASISSGKMDRANFFEAKYREHLTENRVFVSPSMVPDFYMGL